MGMSFARWLQRHIAEDSPTGDLARTARFARIRVRTLDAWEEQLRVQGASRGVLELLHEVWEQYETGAAPPERGKLPAEHDDEFWTITRPVLPNWIGRLPAIVQVRCDTFPEDVQSLVRFACGEVFMAAVEQYGGYFRREFRYDFLPYTAREHIEKGDNQIVAYLFFDDRDTALTTMRPVGACSFWYAPEASCWVLGWIWFHPLARRRGHLAAVWPIFRQQYGRFAVQRPLSDAMIAFLQRVDPAEIGEEAASSE